MDGLNGKTVDEILGLGKGPDLLSTRLVGSSHDKSNHLGGLSSTSRSVKIPKEIMQTWKSAVIPKHWAPSQKSIKTLMPTWSYTLMTDDDNLKFVETYFPDFVFYFKGFEYPIQRADAIRYMWLYVKGGIYIDLDLELVKPLDDLFYEDKDLYVVKSSIMPNVYTNACIGAKSRLSLMLRCLDAMKSPYAYWHVGKHLKVVNSTGPNMFTQAIQDEVSSDLESKSESECLRVTELPGDLIIACSICEPKPCCNVDSYCRLLGGSSWSEGDTAFWTFIFCNRQQLIVLFVVLVIIITVVIVVHRKRKLRRGRH